MNLLIIVIILVSTLMACSSENSKVKMYDVNTYQYSSDNRFLVVDVEHIDDGTVNGITLSTLVDRQTKVMYVLTEKFQSGYGISFDVIINSEGKPLIYDDELK